MPRSIREQVTRGHEIGEMLRADQAQLDRMRRDRPTMPKTPQGDVRREAIDIEGIAADLDNLHDAAVEALDAASAAGQRESAIETANSDRMTGRFPKAGR